MRYLNNNQVYNLLVSVLTISLVLQSCVGSANAGTSIQKDLTHNIQPQQTSTLALRNRIRIGLNLEAAFQKSLLKQLPENYQIGKAYHNRDSFFDALAQCLNNIRNTEEYTDKRLRISCYNFYQNNKELVAEWDLKDQGKRIESQEIYIAHEYYYSKIQYTSENSEECIAGRPCVEGRFLCEELNLEGICFIEICKDQGNGQPILEYYFVNKVEYMSISEQDFQNLIKAGNIPILTRVQRSLHFVPLLKEDKITELAASIQQKRKIEDIQDINPVEVKQRKVLKKSVEEHKCTNSFLPTSQNVSRQIESLLSIELEATSSFQKEMRSLGGLTSEIWQHILSYVKISTLLSIKQTSPSFNTLVNNEILSRINLLPDELVAYIFNDIIRDYMYIKDNIVEEIRRYSERFDKIIQEILARHLRNVIEERGIQSNVKHQKIDKLTRLGADLHSDIFINNSACIHAFSIAQSRGELEYHTRQGEIVGVIDKDRLYPLLSSRGPQVIKDPIPLPVGREITNYKFYKTIEEELEDKDSSLREQVEIFDQLLDAGGSIKYDCEYNSPNYLYWAVEKGNIDLINFLVHKANNKYTNYRDRHGQTPLYIAIKYGHVDAVKLLIYLGADVNIQDETGNSPLHTAIRSIEKTRRIKDIVLKENAIKRYVELVDILMQHSADLHVRNIYGDTPLHLAAREGHIRGIKILLNQGARFSKNNYGHTPIDLAKFSQYTKIVRMLEGQKQKYVQMLLNVARQRDNSEIMDLIQSFINTDDSDQQDAISRTVLYLASLEGHVEMVKLLMQLGVDIHDIEGQPSEDLTDTDDALSENDIDVVNTLLNQEHSYTCMYLSYLFNRDL